MFSFDEYFIKKQKINEEYDYGQVQGSNRNVKSTEFQAKDVIINIVTSKAKTINTYYKAMIDNGYEGKINEFLQKQKVNNPTNLKKIIDELLSIVDISEQDYGYKGRHTVNEYYKIMFEKQGFLSMIIKQYETTGEWNYEEISSSMEDEKEGFKAFFENSINEIIENQDTTFKEMKEGKGKLTYSSFNFIAFLKEQLKRKEQPLTENDLKISFRLIKSIIVAKAFVIGFLSNYDMDTTIGAHRVPRRLVEVLVDSSSYEYSVSNFLGAVYDFYIKDTGGNTYNSIKSLSSTLLNWNNALEIMNSLCKQLIDDILATKGKRPTAIIRQQSFSKPINKIDNIPSEKDRKSLENIVKESVNYFGELTKEEMLNNAIIYMSEGNELYKQFIDNDLYLKEDVYNQNNSILASQIFLPSTYNKLDDLLSMTQQINQYSLVMNHKGMSSMAKANAILSAKSLPVRVLKSSAQFFLGAIGSVLTGVLNAVIGSKLRVTPLSVMKTSKQAAYDKVRLNSEQLRAKSEMYQNKANSKIAKYISDMYKIISSIYSEESARTDDYALNAWEILKDHASSFKSGGKLVKNYSNYMEKLSLLTDEEKTKEFSGQQVIATKEKNIEVEQSIKEVNVEVDKTESIVVALEKKVEEEKKEEVDTEKIIKQRKTNYKSLKNISLKNDKISEGWKSFIILINKNLRELPNSKEKEEVKEQYRTIMTLLNNLIEEDKDLSGYADKIQNELSLISKKIEDLKQKINYSPQGEDKGLEISKI